MNERNRIAVMLGNIERDLKRRSDLPAAARRQLEEYFDLTGRYMELTQEQEIGGADGVPTTLFGRPVVVSDRLTKMSASSEPPVVGPLDGDS